MTKSCGTSLLLPLMIVLAAQAPLSGGCSRQGPAVEPPPVVAEPSTPGDGCEPAGQEVSPAAIEWAGADAVIVDRRWLLTPSTGGLEPLSWPLATADASGSHRHRPYALSPSGQVVAVETEGGLVVGPLRGRPGAPAPLPALSSPIAPDEINLPRTTLAFIGEAQVLLRRYEPYQGRVDRCDLFEIATGRWREAPAECLRGEMAEVYRVRGGPEGLAAIYSVGEGHPDMLIARLTAEGQREVASRPIFSLYPSAQLEVTFAAREPVAWLTTVCPLERAGAISHPCLGPEGIALDEEVRAWRLYRWREGRAELELLADSLPAYTVAGPDGVTVAWPRGSCVCLGDRRGVERRCFERPSSASLTTSAP